MSPRSVDTVPGSLAPARAVRGRIAAKAAAARLLKPFQGKPYSALKYKSDLSGLQKGNGAGDGRHLGNEIDMSSEI